MESCKLDLSPNHNLQTWAKHKSTSLCLLLDRFR